jgi:hypothetical protein
MASATRTAAPSQFAALLRRSKFSSFDPKIAQVYTSFGGYAHRGQFGLKRSLLQRTRKRQRYIVVEAVDTPEQQTEWKDGKNEVKWLERWREIGAPVQLHEEGPWAEHIGLATWQTDSEFDQQAQARAGPEQIVGSTIATRNVSSMHDRRFAKYVEKMRESRPEFHEYLQSHQERLQAASPGSKRSHPIEEQDLYALSQQPSSLHDTFISEKTTSEALQPDSTFITPRPHPTGALTYTHPSQLQYHLSHPPTPGRVFATTTLRTQTSYRLQQASKVHLTGVGGVVARLSPTQAEGVAPMDWTSGNSADLEKGASGFRVTSATLVDAPDTVRTGDTSSSLDGVKVEVDLKEWRTSKLSNPHRPGSAEYVGHRVTSQKPAKKPPINLTNTFASTSWSSLSTIPGRTKPGVTGSTELTGALFSLFEKDEKK